MSVPPEQFARIAGRVNLEVLDAKLVVIVGVGTVGSQIAQELSNSGVGRLRLIDGDDLEVHNLVRHVLPHQYVGMNKAEGMTLHLAEEVPTLRPEALTRYVDDQLSDDELDRLLMDADLIVAATDDRDTQRRLGRRALALDTPTLFPGLYGDDGGEVVLQRSPRLPCFLCWDAFRTENERLRGVTALNADTLALIQLAVRLCLGILDEDSEYAELLRPSREEPEPRQLFVQNGFALAIRPIHRRPNCPTCSVGPSGQIQEPARSLPASTRHQRRPQARSPRRSSGRDSTQRPLSSAPPAAEETSAVSPSDWQAGSDEALLPSLPRRQRAALRQALAAAPVLPRPQLVMAGGMVGGFEALALIPFIFIGAFLFLMLAGYFMALFLSVVTPLTMHGIDEHEDPIVEVIAILAGIASLTPLLGGFILSLILLPLYPFRLARFNARESQRAQIIASFRP